MSCGASAIRSVGTPERPRTAYADPIHSAVAAREVAAGQTGFFDPEERNAALSAAGGPLLRLSERVGLEVFRPSLLRALRRPDRSGGGRPPCDPVLMFKVLVLRALDGLSDDQTEFQIRDWLSFMRFLGPGLHDRVPEGPGGIVHVRFDGSSRGLWNAPSVRVARLWASNNSPRFASSMARSRMSGRCSCLRSPSFVRRAPQGRAWE